MKRKPLDVFKINVPVYDVVLYVLVGDRGDANSWISRKYNLKEDSLNPRWDYQFTSVDFSIGSSDYIIFMKEFQCEGGEIATLAHEVLHATFRILDNAGFCPSTDSEEAYTYLLTHLLSAVLHKLAGAELRRRKLKKKEKIKHGKR